jgi:hypothetical protein
MKFTRRSAGYTKWAHKSNEDILDKLKNETIHILYSELSEEVEGTYE